MLANSVIRLLIVFGITFSATGASQKSFLKGLLIGSLIGHKKGLSFHNKDGGHHHHNVPVPEKEYVPVPVHEEPRYIPIYIVKDCPKKYSKSAAEYHDLSQDQGFKLDGGDGGGDGFEAFGHELGSKYKASLDDGYESRSSPVLKVNGEEEDNHKDNEEQRTDNSITFDINQIKSMTH